MARASVVLNVKNGFSTYVAHVLSHTPGVMETMVLGADVEGEDRAGAEPGVIVTLEASDQKSLDALAAHALASVESATVAAQVMPGGITVFNGDWADPGRTR